MYSIVGIVPEGIQIAEACIRSRNKGAADVQRFDGRISARFFHRFYIAKAAASVV